jgi:hypothetical protein
MVVVCSLINEYTKYTTKASCCGHGKYPMTVIVEDYNRKTGERKFFDFISGIEITRTRNFYKKDKQGVFYIPEVLKINIGKFK